MKTIMFVLDSFELYNYYYFGNEIFCKSYFDTELAIHNNLPNIWTYDIGHLSFDLNSLGYHIVIVHNENFLYIYEGMSTANGKELRFTHDLRKLLIGGAFDNDLNIDRNKFYYNNSISTSELCQQEIDKQMVNNIKISKL